MGPGKLIKRLERSLMVSWREQPTRYDIEALQANIRRVGLVVRVRWALLGVLIVYSLLGALVYSTHIPFTELARLMVVPALALCFVVLYNTFYTLNYKRLGNIAVWNNLQLALDALVVTVLVYFSGGVESWFWSMYALFILEATFILPSSRGAWLHALFSCFLLASVIVLELVGVLPHQTIPFSNSALYSDGTYVFIRYMWQVAVLLGTASVSTLIVGEFRRELDSRRSQTVIDETTGLYSRTYFLRACAAEVRRAVRDHRSVHILLVDIDKFGEFNERFGIDKGDQLLRALAESFQSTLARAGELTESVNTIARFGGEEFVILFSEDERLQVAPDYEAALLMGEQIRKTACDTRIDGAGITVSVGVATMPGDGRSIDELLDHADAALVCAVERGGNAVVPARDCPPGVDEPIAHED